MRLRTQKELMAEIRDLDPNTALTPYALRRLVLSGKIPTVRSGRRYLIDADCIEEYLAYEPSGQGLATGTIRKLNS